MTVAGPATRESASGGAGRLADHDDQPVGDRLVLVRGATWADYQRHLEIRGDRSAPRLAYSDGVLEIMSPSLPHGALRSLIGRLIEVWCLEKGIGFKTCGSWTLENKELARGVEPDECYAFNDLGGQDPSRPDLAIEVVWTSGGLDKLEIYGKLGVREIWQWRRGRITVHVLRGERYQGSDRSEVLPGLDVAALTGYLDRPTTSQAMLDYRASLQAGR